MEDAPPHRRRRSGPEKLADAIAAKERAAARLERKQRQIEKYQAVQKSQARKDDARRKIIAGALALEHKEPVFRGKLMALIDEYVITDRDRALFGLEPLPPIAPPVPVRPAVVVDMPIATMAAPVAPPPRPAPPPPPAAIMTVTAPVVAMTLPPAKPKPPAPAAAPAPLPASKEGNLAAAVKAVAGIALAFGANAIKPDPSRTRKEG